MTAPRMYQFFISSPLEEFKEIRLKIFEQILNLNHIPVGMEYFQGGEPMGTSDIEIKIRRSDVVILILGVRCGSQIEDKENKVSFTHFEYDCARKYNKPVIPILLSKPKYDEYFGKFERNSELDSFRQELQRKSGRFVKFYENHSEIPNMVTVAASASIASLLLKADCGWIRVMSTIWMNFTVSA